MLLLTFPSVHFQGNFRNALFALEALTANYLDSYCSSVAARYANKTVLFFFIACYCCYCYCYCYCRHCLPTLNVFLFFLFFFLFFVLLCTCCCNRFSRVVDYQKGISLLSSAWTKVCYVMLCYVMLLLCVASTKPSPSLSN